MKTAINLLFLGYLFVFLRIQIGVDLFPDPFGYLLIALGSHRLEKNYPIAKKGRFLAAAMVLISFPTMFITEGEAISFGWNAYTTALLFLNIILSYFIFSILINIAQDYGDKALIQRTEKTFTIYISFNLAVLAFLSFSMNVSGDFWASFTLMIMFASFIMEIVFLVLMRAVRRSVPSILNLNIEEDK